MVVGTLGAVFGPVLTPFEKRAGKALGLDPNHTESRVARAGLYLDSKRDADAAADVDEARKRSPREPRAAYLKALLAERSVAMERAARQYLVLDDPLLRQRFDLVLVDLPADWTNWSLAIAAGAASIQAMTPSRPPLADRLLGAIGEAAWVEEEGLIDPVTAVSGGGPAYVFLLAEVMEKAAISQGLPADLARRMARATVAGSGALLGASTEDAATLRRNVTSPKGTTERALAVLMREENWPAIMEEAIEAATAR